MKKLPLLFVFVLLYSIMSCSPDSDDTDEMIKNRNLISRIENGSMPPGNAQDLTAAQVQAVKDWQANSFAN